MTRRATFTGFFWALTPPTAPQAQGGAVHDGGVQFMRSGTGEDGALAGVEARIVFQSNDDSFDGIDAVPPLAKTSLPIVRAARSEFSSGSRSSGFKSRTVLPAPPCSAIAQAIASGWPAGRWAMLGPLLKNTMYNSRIITRATLQELFCMASPMGSLRLAERDAYTMLDLACLTRYPLSMLPRLHTQ